MLQSILLFFFLPNSQTHGRTRAARVEKEGERHQTVIMQIYLTNLLVSESYYTIVKNMILDFTLILFVVFCD